MSSNDGNESPTNNQNNENFGSNNGNQNGNQTGNSNVNVYVSNNDSIANVILDQIINDGNVVITNQQGIMTSGNVYTNTTFDTISNLTVDIDQYLTENVVTGYDNSTETGQIVAQIREYANKIKCEEFHGKGSIDDYGALFTAASKIANETKQMKLDVDVEGFDEFGRAADELSALFTSFTQRIQTVNIIDDSDFLRAVLNALIKIDNLSNVFGKFKDTILVTSTIRIPASAHQTKLILEGVMDEVSCAMNYINHFVAPEQSNNLVAANLSDSDKLIINKAVDTIDSWNLLCDQGVSIALTNNTDIQYIKQTNNDLRTKTNTLKNATNLLRAKLSNIYA